MVETIIGILGLLFIIEPKKINKILDYIGIILGIGIIIYEREMSYITYMLIIINVSALTILFGLIIMLESQPIHSLVSHKVKAEWSEIILVLIVGIMIYISNIREGNLDPSHLIIKFEGLYEEYYLSGKEEGGIKEQNTWLCLLGEKIWIKASGRELMILIILLLIGAIVGILGIIS